MAFTDLLKEGAMRFAFYALFLFFAYSWFVSVAEEMAYIMNKSLHNVARNYQKFVGKNYKPTEPFNFAYKRVRTWYDNSVVFQNWGIWDYLLLSAMVVIFYMAIRDVVSRFKFCWVPYFYSRYQKHFGDSRSFQEEKMMEGSKLEPAAKAPSFQLDVYTRTDSTSFLRKGQAFNTKFGVFTAFHVIEDADAILLKTSEGQLEIAASRFQRLEGDVALLALTPRETQQLQVSQAKLQACDIPPRSGLLVQVQSFGFRTMGLLEPTTSFGMCKYTGSTIKGFSGSPYYVGKNIYGMHIGCGNHNMGLEAAYLYMLAKTSLEDTEDWLMDEIQNAGQEYTWQRSPYDPDEARVKMGNKYYNVDMDLVRRLDNFKANRRDYAQPKYEPETVAKVEDLPLAPRSALSYDDSKNLMSPVGASYVDVQENGEKTARVPVPKPRRLSVTSVDSGYQKPSASCPTTGQMSTPAQPRDHSPSTLESFEPRRVRREVRRLENRLRLWRQRAEAMRLGE